MDPNKQIARVIDRVGDLPAMPDMVADVLRLTDNPDADLNQISKAIERDPALAAKILKISNSPYYGMKQYVGTLKLSLVILGMREVRNIVLGVAMFDALRDSKGIAAVGQQFWAHSFSAASLAKRLGAQLALDLQGEAFVAGLLHDIGKLVLLRYLGPDYVALYKQSGGGAEPLLHAEQETYGFTHADAATALAGRWNFPKTLTDAIWMHHPANEARLADAKDPTLAAVVRLSNLLAHKDLSEEEWERIEAQTEIWELLDSTPHSIPVAQRRESLMSLLNDGEEVALPIL